MMAADQTPGTEREPMAARTDQTERREEMRAAAIDRMQQAFESRKLSELVGMPVNNPEGKNLADLEDIAIDMREGRPVFGIISLPENKMAAIPWSSLNIQPQTKTALLDADEQTLQAVAFSEDSFPNLSSRDYASNVYSRFNREPYWSVYGYVSPGETQRQTGAEQRSTAWGPGSEYAKKFDPSAVSTMEGTIQSVGFFTPDKGAHPGERLRVRTDDGKTVTVHLGPHSFLRDQNVSFQKGDKITITGAQTELNGRSIVIASQVKKDDKTIQLRDDQGKPMWNAQGMGMGKSDMQGQQPGQ
jgi:hypothetical protein